ncbi:hypothetical protein PR048_021200 [Dryococelus australis]|uniref:Transposase Tc1-like domain-containing protein n=1 Tax=Dryococelus australis TaxID=614101 RepID=A0ABQ9GXK3_9NEOP|nr:hypothetical protein PR048_021200 [Dryococelus australis]
MLSTITADEAASVYKSKPQLGTGADKSESFTCGPNELGRNNVSCYRIDTEYSRRMKVPLATYEASEGILKETKELDQIEPLVSPWPSLILVVNKKEDNFLIVASSFPVSATRGAKNLLGLVSSTNKPRCTSEPGAWSRVRPSAQGVWNHRVRWYVGLDVPLKTISLEMQPESNAIVRQLQIHTCLTWETEHIRPCNVSWRTVNYAKELYFEEILNLFLGSGHASRFPASKWSLRRFLVSRMCIYVIPQQYSVAWCLALQVARIEALWEPGGTLDSSMSKVFILHTLGNSAPINEHFTAVYPNHTQFSHNGRRFGSMQQPLGKRYRFRCGFCRVVLCLSELCDSRIIRDRFMTPADKTRQPPAPPVKIPKRENPGVIWPGIKSGSSRLEASNLTITPPGTMPVTYKLKANLYPRNRKCGDPKAKRNQSKIVFSKIRRELNSHWAESDELNSKLDKHGSVRIGRLFREAKVVFCESSPATAVRDDIHIAPSSARSCATGKVSVTLSSFSEDPSNEVKTSASTPRRRQRAPYQHERIVCPTQRRAGSGPRNVTTARDDRRLVCMAVTDRTVSSTVLARHWSIETGVYLSALTVRRRLLRAGLVARMSLRRLPLSGN